MANKAEATEVAEEDGLEMDSFEFDEEDVADLESDSEEESESEAESESDEEEALETPPPLPKVHVGELQAPPEQTLTRERYQLPDELARYRGDSHMLIPGRVWMGRSPATANRGANRMVRAFYKHLGIQVFVSFARGRDQIAKDNREKRKATGAEGAMELDADDNDYGAYEAYEAAVRRLKQTNNEVTFISLPIPDWTCGYTDAKLADQLNVPWVPLYFATVYRMRVYMCCWSGHGRTGMVANMMLMFWYNLRPRDANRYLNKLHAGRHCVGHNHLSGEWHTALPELAVQCTYIKGFRKYRKGVQKHLIDDIKKANLWDDPKAAAAAKAKVGGPKQKAARKDAKGSNHNKKKAKKEDADEEEQQKVVAASSDAQQQEAKKKDLSGAAYWARGRRAAGTHYDAGDDEPRARRMAELQKEHEALLAENRRLQRALRRVERHFK